MKPVRIAATILVLLTFPSFRCLGAAVLLPIFSDNMVLQEGQINVLRGNGPPGKHISIRFKGVNVKKAPISQSGRWEVQLDLRKLSDNKPDRLDILVEGEKTSQRLTNVAVGAVWVVSAGTHQGVRAEPWPNPKLDPGKIRIFTTTNDNLSLLSETDPKGPYAWAAYPKTSTEVESFDTLILRLAEALAEGGGYVGIVQTTPGCLGQGALPADSANRLASYKPLDLGWSRATNDVFRAELAREGLLLQAKRLGIVTNVPPVIPYGPAVLCLRDELPETLKYSVLNFKGAIWPANSRLDANTSPPVSGR